MTKQEKILKRALEMMAYKYRELFCCEDSCEYGPCCACLCRPKDGSKCDEYIAEHFIRKAKEELK